MTRLLLDTHTFVWAISSPQRLGEQARTLILDATNELYVSAATAWELGTKVRLGKFADAEPIVSNYRSILDRLGASELAITGDHALAAGRLSWAHRDPFDRMLAAQAIGEHLTLISADAAFDGLPGLRVRW